MERTQNTYRMPEAPAEVPTIAGYLDEPLDVQLTRRQVYFLRDMLKKRIAGASQGMNDPKTHPQKKRSRYEEWSFLRGIQERLYGSDPDGVAERAEFRASLQSQADALEAKAAEIRELYNSMG